MYICPVLSTELFICKKKHRQTKTNAAEENGKREKWYCPRDQSISECIVTYDTCSHVMQFFPQILLQSSTGDSEMMGVILVQY